MATVAQIMEQMPDRFNAEKAGSMNATIQFNLTGDDGGEWYAVISNGNIAVEEGTADSPKATMTMSASDFTALVTGKLNGMAAFMSGKIKVEGDLNTIMKLQSVLGF